MKWLGTVIGAIGAMMAVGCAGVDTREPGDFPHQPVTGGHVLVMVEDMPSALEKARAAGFSVMHGTPGDSPNNAMIHLKNGWFIELVDLDSMPTAFRIALPLIRLIKPRIAKRIRLWLRAEPWTVSDWSVDVADLDAALTARRARGDKPSKALDFKREQVNHEVTTWQLSLPKKKQDPFLKGPYQNHVPIEGFMEHENGVRELVSLTLTSRDVDETVNRLVQTGVATEKTGESAVLCVGSVEVRVVKGEKHHLGEVVLSAPVPARESLKIGEMELQLAPTTSESVCP